MTGAIFLFELKFWFKNPATYLYACIFFLLGFFSVAGAAGLFQEDISHQIKLANSRLAIYELSNLAFKLMLFVIPSIIGLSVSREFQYKVHSLLYSFPLSRSSFLSAKFSVAFCILSLIWACFISGSMLGALVPGLQPDLIQPVEWEPYFKLLMVYLLPNTLLVSLMVFLINILSRNQFSGFVLVFLFMIIREIGLRLSADIDPGSLALVFEPFAESATSFNTRNWTLAEQNSFPVPLSSDVILNRIVYLSICGLMAVLSYQQFHFRQDVETILPGFIKKKSLRVHINNEKIGHTIFPQFELGSGFIFSLQQIWKLSSYELKSILKRKAFLLVLLFGGIWGFVLQSQINTPYGIKVWPLTWVMLAFPVLFFKLFIAFVSFFYAGIIIHKPKLAGMYCLIDVTPVKNQVLMAGKILALIKLQMLILSSLLISGVLVQIVNTYYDFEIHHYLFDLYCIHLPEIIIWGIAAFFIQSIFSNTWLGLFILALLFFGVSELPLIGIDQLIFRFNQNPDPGFYLHYSDLSGYSHSIKTYFIYKLYWLIFSGILMMIALLGWKRGLIFSWTEHFNNVRIRLQSLPVFIILFLFSGMISLGIWIHFQEKITPVPSLEKLEIMEKESDNKWFHLESLPQPRIIDVVVKMDIYPEEHKFISYGQYLLVNRSEVLIDSICVRTSHEVLTDFYLDKPNSIILKDTEARFNILKLDCPLFPGDSLMLHFSLKSIANTLFNKNNQVEKNGTYITSMIYPTIGYRTARLDRKANEAGARDNHYRSFDSDYISLDLLLSTSKDQIALAPGYLTESYSENGRNYFKYVSKSPVTNDFAFISGKFKLHKETWKGTELEIYYDSEHTFNLDHMILGLKKTLDYQDTNLSPYQHGHIRIVEFSRSLGGFAQSFANFMPFSEISFVMNIQAPNKKGLNLPFLGASHELAHQWWGMQAIPADVEGYKMITEGLAEYTSLMVLKKEYGPEKALEFQKKTLQTYLSGSRNMESTEPALMYNQGNEHAFIPYQKGMLAFNGMAGMIGENCLNEALKSYLQNVKGKGAPYSTPSDFIEHIRMFTPDSMLYLIHDMFESVSFYDNSIDSVLVDSVSDGTFELNIYFSIQKYSLNEKGEKQFFKDLDVIDKSPAQTDLFLQDYIQLGIFNSSTYDDPLYSSLIKVTSRYNHIRIKVAERPHRIELDPWMYLIDLNSKDNVYRIAEFKFHEN